MSDVFISYSRSTDVEARRIGDALKALGYSVWRDDELPAHRAYSDVIAERLKAAKAVVVVWSADAVKSQWVRAEADQARNAGKLVQLSIDGALPPLPFDQIQCVDLRAWSPTADAPGWHTVLESIADLAGPPSRRVGADAATVLSGVSICVLPFANMSDDAAQAYFSDGICEDIITDLSKVAALSVVSRTTSFRFKGERVSLREIAQQLKVTHVLEGSVRKAEGRVRITVQLIDGSTDAHLWAERYDRDFGDVLALQTDISKAVVAALKVKLLPQERAALERRGTTSAEAYDLYLLARQFLFLVGTEDARWPQAMLRILRRAIEIDPSFAQAWALIARSQRYLQVGYGILDADGGLLAAERALGLDPNLADPHTFRAFSLEESGRADEADAEIRTAIRLDPESFEINRSAGTFYFRRYNCEAAIPYLNKAVSLWDRDLGCSEMLMACHKALGDRDSEISAAQVMRSRAEREIANDPMNVRAVATLVAALAVLGEPDKAKSWIARASLVDPDDWLPAYNLACAVGDGAIDAAVAIDLLGPFFEAASATQLDQARLDRDLDPLRADPRFEAMMASAQARLAKPGSSSPPAPRG